MKKVCVIIPIYNVERYLSQCLDSVIRQSYPNLEVILIDDGSTDESGKICDEYAQQDNRVKVIHQANAGAASAKNAGLDNATGDYIAFLDSDDYVEPNWIEKMVTSIENADADVAECDFVKEYVNRTEPGNTETYTAGSFTGEEYLGIYLHNWTCCLFWNKLFKAELVKEIRFRRERRCIDDEFFTYKILSGAKKILRIEDRLYHYRQRKSSVVFSEKNKKQITDDALEILIERYKWICERFPKLRRIYLSHDVDIMFYFAREFLFTEDTIRKFRKTARYYLVQSILHYPGRITLQYALMLQAIKSKSFQTNYTQNTSNIANNLFP